MSESASLSPDVLAALRAKHIAFLKERLVNDHARADFVRSVDSVYDELLGQPLATLVEPRRLVEGLHAVTSEAAVRGLLAPIAREAHRRAIRSLRSDESKIGDYVPKDARESIDRLLARSDLLPETLVRKVFEDEIVEHVMRDVLYDALVEFNVSVNPFFAEWGLPALLKRVLPIGSGTVLKSMSALKAEFDKRLEPEIRKFLLGFARKAKVRIADFVVASSGDPKTVALRQSAVALLYELSISALLHNVDDDARMELDDAALAVALEIHRQERPRERLIAELEAWLEEHGQHSLGTFLTRLGVTERPNLEPLAELAWPHVKWMLETPAARAFWERVTHEFYASLEG